MTTTLSDWLRAMAADIANQGAAGDAQQLRTALEAADRIEELERQLAAATTATTSRLDVVELRPGDSLILTPIGVLGAEARQRLGDYLRHVWPGRPIAILQPGMTVQALRELPAPPADVEAFDAERVRQTGDEPTMRMACLACTAATNGPAIIHEAGERCPRATS